MKKSFPVNLNNTILYIDEDAYNLLTNYFDRLRSAFPGEEGSETIADIESRIGEILHEKAGHGSIVTIKSVNEAIAIMGSPEQLGATDCRDSGRPQESRNETESPAPRKLYRDLDNKILGGVLSGMAIRYDWDLNVLRALVIVIGLFTGIFPVVVIYMIAWMVIPAAVTARQRLEMRGERVSVETVSQSVIANNQNSTADTLGFIINLAAKCALGFAALIAAIVGAATAIGAILCLLAAMGYTFGSAEWMEATFNIDCGNMPVTTLLGGMSAQLAVMIPAAAVIWTACTVFFKTKGASRKTIILACLLEVSMIVGAIVLISAAERSM